MRRISTPGKDDNGSILLDVLMSLLILTLTILPFYSNYRNLIKAGEKQRNTLDEILKDSMDIHSQWYFESQNSYEE